LALDRSVEDPFCIVGLRFGDRMHALRAPEVKSHSEQFQCFVRAVPIIFGQIDRWAEGDVAANVWRDAS